jgi:hypothetical protein
MLNKMHACCAEGDACTLSLRTSYLRKAIMLWSNMHKALTLVLQLN